MDDNDNDEVGSEVAESVVPWESTDLDTIQKQLTLEERCFNVIVDKLPHIHSLRELPADVGSQLITAAQEKYGMKRSLLQLLHSQELCIVKLELSKVTITSDWISQLITLDSLRSLDLSGSIGCTSRHVRTIALRLSNLEELMINDCPTVDHKVVQSIAILKHLTRLELGSFKNLNNRDLVPLHTLTHLEAVGLRRCELITEIPRLTLNAWKALSKLDLSYTRATPAAIRRIIKHVSTLTHLSLEGCLLSDQDLLQLPKGKSRLEVLHLSRNPLIRPMAISQLSLLRELFISNTEISTLDWLPSNLQYLDISDTDISDDALGVLCVQCPALHNLDIRANAVTIEGLHALKPLARLRRFSELGHTLFYVNAIDCNITEEDAQTLHIEASNMVLQY